jgi:hypothetical protein
MSATTHISRRPFFCLLGCIAVGSAIQAAGQCGYDCTVQVSLCSDHASCQTSACIETYCGTGECNDCSSYEAGVCTCPDGTKVSPDHCSSLGDCTLQCASPRSPSRRRGEIRERLLGRPPLLPSSPLPRSSLAPSSKLSTASSGQVARFPEEETTYRFRTDSRSEVPEDSPSPSASASSTFASYFVKRRGPAAPPTGTSAGGSSRP